MASRYALRCRRCAMGFKHPLPCLVDSRGCTCQWLELTSLFYRSGFSARCNVWLSFMQLAQSCLQGFEVIARELVLFTPTYVCSWWFRVFARLPGLLLTARSFTISFVVYCCNNQPVDVTLRCVALTQWMCAHLLSVCGDSEYVCSMYSCLGLEPKIAKVYSWRCFGEHPMIDLKL